VAHAEGGSGKLGEHGRIQSIWIATFRINFGSHRRT
jgi:hypothetical protein